MKYAESPVTVLLLGASNLARAQWAVAARLRSALAPRRVRVLSAAGPGRAYRVEGGFLHVRYAPISSCGVLEAAADAAAGGRRLVALATDIGNDLLYGVPAADLVETLEGVFGRLRALDAAIVATAIPLDVRADLSERRFRLLRALFYPASTLGYEEAARAVATVNRFFEEQKEELHVVRGLGAYAGFDRIHYRLLSAHRAWTRITAAMLRALDADSSDRIGLAAMAGSTGRAAGHALVALGRGGATRPHLPL